MNNPIPLRKVFMADYIDAPSRYELRSGSIEDAPSCPFGNRYRWIGYDLEQKEYVRITKSVFKRLIKGLSATNLEHG